MVSAMSCACRLKNNPIQTHNFKLVILRDEFDFIQFIIQLVNNSLQHLHIQLI